MRPWIAIGAILLGMWAAAQAPAGERAYPWLPDDLTAHALRQRIPPPPGFVRDDPAAGSFARWLQRLPLKPGRPPVRYWDGTLVPVQDGHCAVLELDIGRRDLLQCADAAIRLRAEFLYAAGRADAVAFRFTSGHEAAWRQWQAGERPRVSGNRVNWIASAAPDASYASFQRYLRTVFAYAGSYSLARDLPRPAADRAMRGGDLLIIAGFPGHVMIVVDAARHPESGRRVVLLVQGYYPAQDVHVLANPEHPDLDPWFEPASDGTVTAAGWTFSAARRHRFPALADEPE
ncbi:MAG TPA: DUF4846 domain-containing protein [Acidobacteriota bacterium]|nr:DUF4846 domain-containing protein [Acidobacteriota bacterium]HQF88715.1 DUF4846 domain-containing protein [Acidobacteriota bacterium]HQG91491.1 DUF4846 domain-containing protein [Acidobacteriota bacterium]HQK87988.1 DUF4846 domain-containing protein [Acidobacteriota bacterium]